MPIHDDSIRTLIYIFIVLMFPLNLYATYKLWRLSRRYGNSIGALDERKNVAMILLVASLAGSILAFCRLFGINVVPSVSIIMNGVAAIMAGLPAVYWTIKYNRHGFGEDDDG